MVKIVKKKVSPSNFGFSIWSVFAQGTCLMFVCSWHLSCLHIPNVG
jgi:hypothetical protein